MKLSEVSEGPKETVMEVAGRHRFAFWMVALGSPLGMEALVKLLPSLVDAGDRLIVFREAMLIFCAVGWLGWLARSGMLTAEELGLSRFRISDLGWGILAALATLVLSLAVMVAMDRFGLSAHSPSAIAVLARRPPALLFLIVLTAAISEEAIFRAAILSALTKASGSRVFAVIFAAASFAAVHYSGYNAGKVVLTIVPGVLWSGLFIWRKSLAACIIAHLAIDLIGLAGLLFRT